MSETKKLLESIQNNLNEGSEVLRIYKPGSPEYKALENFANELNNDERFMANYYVGETYFDYGQNWKITTILAKTPNGSSINSTGYQALTPRNQENVINGNNLEEVKNDILEYDIKFTKNLRESNNSNLKEAIDWNYYDKFNQINKSYLPSSDEGDTMATQIVTAINKLVYKWYNDGDVFDNVNSGLEGWANDLSSYANWLYTYVPETKNILTDIYNITNTSDYEILLKNLADLCLNEEFLSKYNKESKKSSIYDCDGPFEFSDEEYDDEEYDEEW